MRSITKPFERCVILGAVCGPFIGLTLCLAQASDETDTRQEADQPRRSLLSHWQQLEVPPILHYHWQTKPQHRAARFNDYLEMGFTGILKIDHDAPHAGRLFRQRKLHGFLKEVGMPGGGEPVIRSSGDKLPLSHPWLASVFSEKNVDRYYGSILHFIESYGVENLFTVDDVLVMQSWDETGLRTRRFMEYGYTAGEEFGRYLQDVVFQDDKPGQDTNGDRRTFNRETSLDLDEWAQVPLPAFDNRYDQPGLWKLWNDFHGYYTYLFFERASRHVSDKLGRDFELYTFSHGSAKWPGATSKRGLDLYWQARLNRVLTVEDCQADYPGSTVFYAFTNQLSRRYDRPVVAWAWFWPDFDVHHDPLQIGRSYARILGHHTHGLIFWVYHENGAWRAKPAARATVAYWQNTYRAQWPFLREAAPPTPQVAVVRSRNTGNMYDGYDYPKLDFGWTCAALSELHVPFDVISDNQIEFEPEILQDYRVLLIPTATWTSARFRRAVSDFLANDGYVYTNADSFALDTTTGQSTQFLQQHFSVKPQAKYKASFMPTYESTQEHTWVKQHAKGFMSTKWHDDADPKRLNDATPIDPTVVTSQQLTTMTADLPKVSGTGLPQQLIDPNSTAVIHTTDAALRDISAYRTFHDIVTTDDVGDATVLAKYDGKPVATRTERTLWLGFRPGFDHACLFPAPQMGLWGEPVWPFDINLATLAAERRGPRRWIGHIIEMAGIQPPIEVRLNGRPAAHIEVLIRRHGRQALVFVINHDPISGSYELSGDMLTDAESCREIRSGVELKRKSSGDFTLAMDAHEVAMVAIGDSTFVTQRQRAQESVAAAEQVKPMPEYD